MDFCIDIPSDADGHVTFQCPFCDSHFKLKADEYNDSENPFDDLCCPYCGLSRDKGDFFSEDVIAVAMDKAENYAVELINNSLEKTARSINTSGFIKMDFTPLAYHDIKDLAEDESDECEYKCSYCDRHFKVVYCTGESKAYCPYCGVDLL